MSKKYSSLHRALIRCPDLQNLLDRSLPRAKAAANVVMVRLSDERLAQVDQLVESDAFQQPVRSNGVPDRRRLESRRSCLTPQHHTKEIRKLKEQLRKVAARSTAANGEEE